MPDYHNLDASEKFKITERYIVSVLHRIIPGEYRHLCDIDSRTLAGMGFDFTTAIALMPTNLFRDITGGGKGGRKTVKSLVENHGCWHFALETREGNSAADLQLAVWTTTPHQVMTSIMDAECCKAPVVLLQHKGGHFIIMNGVGLKSLARRGGE